MVAIAHGPTDVTSLAAREQAAWALARSSADALRRRFGADRVALVGSLARGRFGAWSDVDLVVWGIPEPDWLRAVGAVAIERNDPSDLSVDIVIGEHAKPEFLAETLRESLAL